MVQKLGLADLSAMQNEAQEESAKMIVNKRRNPVTVKSYKTNPQWVPSEACQVITLGPGDQQVISAYEEPGEYFFDFKAASCKNVSTVSNE